MEKKTGKHNQGDSNFVKFFFDLFYRTNWNLEIKDLKLLPPEGDISILICGAGSCVHELPVFLTLFESNKYTKVKLNFVDKAEEPFKLLHYILQKYSETKKREDIGKDKIAKYFENHNDNIHDFNTDTDYSISICKSTITYSFHVMDLELDPQFATPNRYTEFNEYFKKDTKYDIVMMSMFLQHISYWRSLIAFLNEHLEEGGYFWFNEFGKDDYLLTLDLYMAIIDNKRKSNDDWKYTESRIIDYFEKEYYNKDKDQMLFSIISDNDELSPTNTEICRDFFDFFDSKGKTIFEENFRSNIIPSEIFENAKVKFSPFTKLHSLIEDETLSPTFSEKTNDELDFSMTWYAYSRVKDEKIKHFDVLDKAAKHMDILVLQQYINRTLDILNLNSSIFRPTFLRKEGTSKKMVESAIHLFRRFQLFKIGNFKSIVFYIPGITTVKCFKDTTDNYQDDFDDQNNIHIIIDKYNNYRARRFEEGSNSNFFFDKYKTKMTKPFSIFYEPLVSENVNWEKVVFKINEYDYSPNRKVHIIKVEGRQTESQIDNTFVTPLGVSFNQSSLRDWYRAYHKYFKGYRSIFIPCFREPLFDKNKEFLGDLIMTQDVSQKETEKDVTSIEFFSWLIRKFIDFTQIATYFDYKRIILQSLKSAIAAIMSRNMSHNLGSHFISNTKNYFNTLIESDPNNKENYRGIKHALQYIQERMDFIATITSTDTYPFGAVNAKAQIFDELTPDDFGKRHGQKSYNFLMDNLVLSEKISKQSRVANDSLNKLKLQIGHWDGNGGPVFWDPTESKDEENKKRDEILGINFAIPGGIFGRHAVFSIIENIIRNAAKHGQDKIHEKEFIVKMLYRTDENRLIVFDNKNDVGIKGTVGEMKEKLKKIRFLTPEGALDPESKGLKEMLICAIWLQNENVSQVMTDNDSQNEENRLETFNKYLKVVAVDENGVEIKELKNDTTGFLGYSIKLDQYERVHYLKEEELTSERLRNIQADVVCYKEDREIGEKKLSEIFPRFLVFPSENYVKSIGDIEILRRVVENNCGNEALQRKMVVDYTADYKNNSNVVSYKNWDQNSNAFLFRGHAGKSKWDKFNALFLTKGFEDKYVDAISGGDFTYTLVQPSFFNDEYNLLKIKESVATRFVIIDERIYEHYKSMVRMTSKKGEAILEGSKSKRKVGEFVFKIKQVLGNGIYSSHEKELDEYVKSTNALSVFLEKDIEQHYLERRGLYVFNLESEEEGFKMVDLSSNEKMFLWEKVEEKKDIWKFDCNDNRFDTKTMTFLSIHLGLIDKIKDQLLKNGENNGDTIDKEIVAALKLYFGAKFVTIHSGRGGFDIRDSLRQYAFQSFSAIENPLYNSKFLLAKQFYTLKYYGTE